MINTANADRNLVVAEKVSQGQKEGKVKYTPNKLNTDSKVLADLRSTVKVTKVYAGIPVTSISQVSRAVHQTSAKVLADNKATMNADNATVAHELLIAGII